MREAVKVRQKRVRLTPRGRYGYGEGMLELGITLLHSGTMFRNVAELDKAVAVLEAAEKQPDGSADRSLVLTSLGNARLERLLRSAGRSQAELDTVIADHTEAMHERVPDSQNALVTESDYGSAFFRAYELTRNREYLDSSVGPVRRAAEQTPAGHSRKSERLSNLVSVLVALFECDGDPATLDEAIRTGREAVAAAGPRHAQYATCLFGLASGLFRRGNCAERCLTSTRPPSCQARRWRPRRRATRTERCASHCTPRRHPRRRTTGKAGTRSSMTAAADRPPMGKPRPQPGHSPAAWIPSPESPWPGSCSGCLAACASCRSSSPG